MKMIIAALALVAAAGCSHKQVKDAPADTSAAYAQPAPVLDDTATVSGAPSSLGAVSSGRGH